MLYTIKGMNKEIGDELCFVWLTFSRQSVGVNVGRLLWKEKVKKSETRFKCMLIPLILSHSGIYRVGHKNSYIGSITSRVKG